MNEYEFDCEYNYCKCEYEQECKHKFVCKVSS